MSFLQEAEKIKTAQQITSWIQQAHSSMQIAKDCVVKLKTQRQAMTTNTEYAAEDVASIDAEIAQLITLANELING